MIRRRRLLGAACVLLALPFGAELGWRGHFWLKNGLSAGFRGPGSFELFVVGESTAFGLPYGPSFSFPRLTAERLGGRAAGRPIVLRSLAVPGDSIYPQYARFRRETRFRDSRRPGAVLIYAGHNDARGNTGKVPLQRASPSAAPSETEKLKRSWSGRSLLLEDLIYHGERLNLLPKTRTVESYEFYLAALVEHARRAGLIPILSTVIGNVADIEPGLWPGEELPLPEILEFARTGERLERETPSRALAYYRAQAASRPGLAAYASYREGKCRERLGDRTGANRAYWRAVDLNARDNFGRATTAQNEAVRRVARQLEVPLVDAVRLFEEASPGGLVGGALFADGHHPNPDGALLLSLGFARAVAGAAGGTLERGWTGAPAALAEMGVGAPEQAAALVASGGWLIYVSEGHAYPRRRLELARASFSQALALEPDNFSAWLGLGLAWALAPENPARDARDAAWYYRRAVFAGSGYSGPPELFGEVVERLKRNGVSERILSEIARTRR